MNRSVDDLSVSLSLSLLTPLTHLTERLIRGISN